MLKMFHHTGEVQRTPAKPTSHESSDDDQPSTYDCDMCDCGDWQSETEVEMHKKHVHLRRLTKLVTKKRNICKTCLKHCADVQDLTAHIKVDHLYSSITARRVERDIFICHHCDQIFFNKQLLRAHMVYRHLHKSNTVVIKCAVCHKKKSSRALYHHMTLHQVQSTSICPICVQKQRNTKALARHIHTHPKYYHCNICGFISTREKHYNLHLDGYERRVKRFKVNKYLDYFLKPFKKGRWTYNPLKVGLQGLTIYNQIYICILCRQICMCHTEMQEHILRDHSSEPEAIELVVKKVCSCGEEFSNAILLKHHIFKTQHKLPDTQIVRMAVEDSSGEKLQISEENEEGVVHQIETSDCESEDKS